MISVRFVLALALAPPTRTEAAPVTTEPEVDTHAATVADAPPLSDERTSEPESQPGLGPEALDRDLPREDARAPAEHAPPPRVSEPHPGVVGGYWDMDRTLGPEPKDGEYEIIAGAILVPLGIISVSSSAASVWLSAPGHCLDRWGSIGASPSEGQCKGLRTFGIIRVTYGSLMVITGAVLLGIGMTRREKHRKWERGQALVPRSIVPWFGARGGGLAYGGRFGSHRW